MQSEMLRQEDLDIFQINCFEYIYFSQFISFFVGAVLIKSLLGSFLKPIERLVSGVQPHFSRASLFKSLVKFCSPPNIYIYDTEYVIKNI